MRTADAVATGHLALVGLRLGSGLSTLEPLNSSTCLLWLLLPACASVLLLATTNKMCQDVAVIPFLWVLPLALYLLSFIICFDSPRWYVRFPFTLALVAALGGFCWALFNGSDLVPVQTGVYCGGLFVCCMVCHGELYRLRPDPRQLTGYYLMIAAGGALGGLFVAVVAPLMFTDYYELHWGLFLCGLLFLLVCVCDRAGSSAASKSQAHMSVALDGLRADPRRVRRPRPVPGVAARSGQGHAARRLHRPARRDVDASWRCWQRPGSRARSSGVPVLALAGLRLVVAGPVALGAVLWKQARDTGSERVYRSRNFYGVLTVYEHEKSEPLSHHFLLQHGRITHGLQFADPVQATWPISYYGPESGIGLGVNALPAGQRRIGVVGLGTGTMAAFARAGDYLRFYEINPQVQAVATSWFSYLPKCPGKVEVAPGDARLSLEREPPQHFDLLVLDAFSSDAIPVHLLTKEAFEVYGRHLNPNGLIAVHISNHYLDLEPVVVNLARQFGYKLASIDYEENEEEWWFYGSTWILLSRNEQLLNRPAIRDAASTIKTNRPRSLSGRTTSPASFKSCANSAHRLGASAKFPRARCPGEFDWRRGCGPGPASIIRR